MKYYTLNQIGQKRVQDFVKKNDKRDLIDVAYFSEAERSANESNEFSESVFFEIKAFHAESGNPIIMNLYDDDFDTVELE